MASLVYTDGDTVEYSFTVGVEPVLVGRAPECAIRSNHPLVSRNHARFYVDQAGTLYIEDLGSANGVFVGQQRVSHSSVPVGEIVVVGSLTFRQMPDAHAQPPAYGQPPNASPPADPYAQPPADPYAQPPANPYGQPPPPNAFAQQPGDVSTQPASHAYGQPGNAYTPAAGTPMTPPPMAAPAMPPPMAAPAMPPPIAAPAGGADLAIAHLLETERKARVAAEEERDAYGARMAELHGELRALRQQVEQLQANPLAAAPARNPELEQRLGELLAERTKALSELGTAKEKGARLEAQLQSIAAAGGGEARLASLEAELESYRERLTDADDRVKGAESRLASCEEELSVARADLLQSEERMMSEMAASEQRASAELAMRVDELNVARADVTNAEERIMDLSRKVSELEQQLAQLRGQF